MNGVAGDRIPRDPGDKGPPQTYAGKVIEESLRDAYSRGQNPRSGRGDPEPPPRPDPTTPARARGADA